ncbi:MAG TPA: inorganic phosphate transporter, partial [Desulfuromonadaceae bacterium]|nr:inorganic phosphate transporter [Desulfuromonadaceae bacterium]
GAFDSFGSKLNFLYHPDHAGSVSAAQVEWGRLDAEAGKMPSAVNHYQKAADAGDKTGKYLLAQALKNGDGIKADPAKAEKILADLAAAKFDASSIKPAAPIARKFKDAPESPVDSARWLQQKADAGNADAMVALGTLYMEGTGVAQDYLQAKGLFEQAAARNHPAAFYDLGVLYAKGLGIPQDPAQAERCFRTCIKKSEIPVWIIVLCGLTMCAGTAVGGWRIIKTLGHKMVKLHPVHGFAAEATGATILFTAAHYGMPVSTTHAITTSIMGVGAAKSFNALKLVVVERILWAWVLTLPVSAAIAYAFVEIALSAGWM